MKSKISKPKTKQAKNSTKTQSRSEILAMLTEDSTETSESQDVNKKTSESSKSQVATLRSSSSKNTSTRLDLVAMLSGEDSGGISEKDLEVVSKESHYPHLSTTQNQTEKNNLLKTTQQPLIDYVLKVVPSENIDEFISAIKETQLRNPRSDNSEVQASNQEESNRKKQPVVPNIARNKKKNLIKKKSNDAFLIHWNGRFGNRMHTYAYLKNRTSKLGGKIYLPSKWEGDYLFNLENDYEIISDDELRLNINQTHKDLDNLTHRMNAVQDFESRSSYKIKYASPDNPKENYKKYNHAVAIDSVSAYHRSIFENMKLSDVLKWYEFRDEVKNLDIYKRLEDKQGTYDIAHLRRDDISNVNYSKNGGYSTISKDAYLAAFKKYDYDPAKVEWTSDDWSGKWGVGNSIESGLISARGGWQYPEGATYLNGIIFDWLPDFLRLYFARSIFRANSSFSFWACTLAKGRETPPKIFSPRLDKRVLYRETRAESMFDFEEGNHPHWLCIAGKDQCDDIVFSDEPKPKKWSKK